MFVLRTMICEKFCNVLWILLCLVSPIKGTRTARQSYEGVTCSLPEHPDNGQWRVLNGNAQPGDTVEANTILQFSCNDGYKITGESSYIICTRDFDPKRLRECARLCPAMYSSTTTTLKCVDKANKEINCTEATDGSYMTYDCIPFYEPPIGYRKNILCLDGIWNYPKPVCQPVCGKKIDQGNIPLVYGGTVPKSIEYPWITAIFRKENGEFVNVCGGTLISRRVVLTAAHCVTDDYGDALPIQDFVVGVGKYYNRYNEPKDDQAQYMETLRIITRGGYRGPIRNYIEDIGLIITRKLVKLTSVVQPACINDINNIHLRVGYNGEIAGWGIKEDGLPSDTLRKLSIPYKDQTQCAQELNLHDDFADKYNMIDKMCAGFYNKNISVCKGDSGSGLVFKNPEDNRYYIHGIVSIGPANKGKCAIHQNTLYTRVSFYFDFIDRELTKSYIEDCRLPAYPTNGHWTLEFDMDKGPGDIVPSTTTLKITCKDGYRLSAENSLISCDSTFDMPTCDVQCSGLNFPTESRVTCVNKRRRQIDCQWATDGSYVQYHCLDDHGKYGTKNIRQCVNGSWGSPAPTCPKRTPTTTTTRSTTTPKSTSTTSHTIHDGYRGPKVICTYASWWSYKGVDPEHLDPFLCTHIVYAFAGIWNYGDVRIQDDYLDLDKDQGATKGLFRRVTDLKNINKNLKVILSIGGSQASNSSLFSEIAGKDGKIAPFIGSALYFLKEYNFDGLNIDWHNPDVADKDKYINFLSAVRDKLREKNYLLTVNVGSDPENTGYDAKMISRLVDWIVVKTFDFYGSWSNFTGQNSALYPSSKEYEWEKKHLNVHASVNNWLQAGLPRDKLMMSVAFYGRTITLADSSKHDVHSPAKGGGPGEGGMLRLSEICQDYVNDYIEVWDDEQKNAYKYNDKYWFGYETKDSAWIKGAYVKEKKLAGVNIWPVDGDDVHGKCGRKHNFLKHVHGGMGNTVDWTE